MKRLVAAGAVLAALAATAGAVAPANALVKAPADPAAPTRGVAFRPCAPELGLPATFECATVTVPLDYANPRGRQISVTINRLKASGPKEQYQGVLLVNPGGPGGSGLSFAAALAGRLPEEVLAAYDLVGFDPRGVGASTPVHCADPAEFFPAPQHDYVPANWREEKYFVDRAQWYARACGEEAGDLLPYLNTENTARDLDRIRAALGVDTINYLGYSYGTYLGAVYGTLFPERVRRMVLDSAVNPEGVWYDDNIDQDYAFQARFQDFLDWVAEHDDVFHLGTTRAQAQARWDDFRARLEARPAGGKVGPAELEDMTVSALYSPTRWSGIARAFSDYMVAGEEDTLADMYAPRTADDENAYAIYLSVECRDARWPRNWMYWHVDNWRVYRDAPLMTWENAWYNAPCAFWPQRGGIPVRIDGKRLPGLLMFQATRDPATPYEGALVMHEALPTSRLVVEQGGGKHGLYALENNSCVDAHGTEYLLAGKLPRKDVTCPATPLPAPSAATVATQGADGPDADLELVRPPLR